MKKKFEFPSGETITSDLEDLKALLAENQHYLDNYMDVFSCLDDVAYIARGNGFCDSKYSDDFIEGQIEKYRCRVEIIQQWIKDLSKR
jgi:hypothetical protein